MVVQIGYGVGPNNHTFRHELLSGFVEGERRIYSCFKGLTISHLGGAWCGLYFTLPQLFWTFSVPICFFCIPLLFFYLFITPRASDGYNSFGITILSVSHALTAKQTDAQT